MYNRTVEHNPPCSELHTGTVYADRSGFHSQWDPKRAIFVHHRMSPPSNNTWVEVTHCHTRKRKGVAPTRHLWTYVTPDSGIRLNVGLTIGFTTHAEAARSVGVRCTDKWCIGGMPETFDVYTARGYDSIYFRNGETAHRCSNGHAIELVFLYVREHKRSACPIGQNMFRDHRYQPCRCIDVNDCAMCARAELPGRITD